MWAVTDKRTGAILAEYLSEHEARHAIDDADEPVELEVTHFDEEEE